MIFLSRTIDYGGKNMNIYDFEATLNTGEPISLSSYKGKVLLIVNTATRCGFTPQYTWLEKLYEQYHEQGFEILDFPCNQFLFQAPGSDEDIHSFCTMKYDTKFPRFKKIEVKGKSVHPLYDYLINLSGKKVNIKWNFTKFLVGKDGEVIARYEPRDKEEAVREGIEKALAL